MVARNDNFKYIPGIFMLPFSDFSMLLCLKRVNTRIHRFYSCLISFDFIGVSMFHFETLLYAGVSTRQTGGFLSEA